MRRNIQTVFNGFYILKNMNKKELLAHVGDISQIGGITDFTFNDGKRKGVRAIEVNTGNLRFVILPDRGMDIAQAFYKGSAFSWISKTGITAPTYYEKDEKNFLRGFFGGLVTTCGLKNIGKPYGEYGLHDRIANTPAEDICVFTDWVDDEYVMKISGKMRESNVFGENLVLNRTITTKLFADEFTLEDTIINEGFKDEEIALCYHCNFGYPLVNENARIINVPEEFSYITSPADVLEEDIPVEQSGEYVTVGIQNKNMGAYITYKTDTLPEFLLWKMLGRGDYAVGLEPRTSCLEGEEIKEKSKYVLLKPFQEYRTYLKFEIR